ncbi:MAG TPA: apolipoprotein N-acyltransferase, partial [Desulfuromonadales bacterium]|nr:apolipoprotein N-acyltransferase [Desulfuromonadales bacterium]
TAYLMLAGYLALYFGTATWAACRFKEQLRLPVPLTLPVLWMALEFLRGVLLTGFPWALIGYSQQGHLALIQSADLFGVYGIGALIVLCNAALAELIIWLRQRQGAPPLAALVVAALLFAANLGYGQYRLGENLDVRSKTVPVALVQGDIDQGVKWNPAYQKKTIDIYRNLSLQAAAAGPLDLVIWPESATPFFFQDGGPLSDEVSSVPRRTGAELLFGSPAYRVENRRYRYLDSAFLLSRQGGILGRSDKIHLVPFGEYVPLKRFLPFVNKLVVGIGDFSPGTVNPLPMDGHKIGVLVCYEAIFPEIAREYVQMGSDLLVNITNDAWFGRSSAPYQLLAMSRFRAVENRVWLARAANTGISALIAPSGTITVRSSIFKRLELRGRVGLGARPTLYTRTGDLLPILALVVSLLWLVRTRRRFARA